MSALKPIVILATNNPYKQRLIQNQLSESYNIICKDTGHEVVEFFDILQSKVQLVILENQLEDMDCISLLKVLKKKSISTEFIVIADQNNLEETVHCFKEGVLDYIPGDIEGISFLELVDKSLKNMNLLNKIKQITQQLFLDELSLTLEPDLMDNLIESKYKKGEIIKFEDIVLEGISHDSGELKKVIKNQLIKDLPKKNETSTILIIEDDEDACENLEEVLSDNYNIFIAKTVRTALSILEKEPNISVVLLDVYLPDGNGVELIPQIKKINNKASIVIMTAYKESEIARKAMLLGAEEYFNKPLIMADVITTITRVLQLRYFQIEWPNIEKDIIANNITYKVKLNLLTRCCENKVKFNEDITMKDVYTFFPELSKLNIDSSTIVPGSVLESGVMLFVDELKTKLDEIKI